MTTRPAGKRAGNAIQRREKISSLLHTIGIHGIRRQATIIAQQFNVSRQQIQDDVKVILKNIPIATQEEIVTNLKIGLERAEEESLKILTTSTIATERLMAARTLSQLAKEKTELMERWGIKSKVADQVNVTGGVNIMAPEWWYEQQKKKEANDATKKVPNENIVQKKD